MAPGDTPERAQDPVPHAGSLRSAVVLLPL